jgi:hypothetical protein
LFFQLPGFDVFFLPMRGLARLPVFDASVFEPRCRLNPGTWCLFARRRKPVVAIERQSSKIKASESGSLGFQSKIQPVPLFIRNLKAIFALCRR